MSMVPQPQCSRRALLGKVRPVQVHEIWSGKVLRGHTVRRTVADRTAGWLAVPAVDVRPRRFRRHTDAVRWLVSL